MAFIRSAVRAAAERGAAAARHELPQQLLSKNLFLGGLPPSATERSVHAFFRSFGRLKTPVKVIQPRETERAAFGFVEFEDCGSVLAAVEELEIRRFEGRLINLYFTKDVRSGDYQAERGPREGRSFDDGGRGGFRRGPYIDGRRGTSDDTLDGYGPPRPTEQAVAPRDVAPESLDAGAGGNDPQTGHRSKPNWKTKRATEQRRAT